MFRKKGDLMIASLIFLAAQGADATQALQDLEAMTVRAERVLDQAFTCMDQQVKEEFVQQAIDGTAQSVVDGAMSECSYLKDSYVSAVTSEYIPPEKAKEITETAFSSLRETYVSHIEEQMIEPEMADARTKVGLSAWRECVTDKASEWSRLQDEAATVARAAISACASFKPKVQALVVYQLRSKRLGPTEAGRVIEGAEDTLEDVAVGTVISERASRLSPAR